MILVHIAVLVLVLAVIWIAVRVVFHRAPTRILTGAPDAIPSRALRQVENNGQEALALLATCVQPRGTGNLTTAIQLRVIDQAPADWYFDLAQGQCSLVPGLVAVAPLTLSASGHVWGDLAAKRIGFAQAAMKGNLQSEGDTSILMRLDDEFSGAPNPERRPSVQANWSSPTTGSPGANEAVEITNPSAAANPVILQRQAVLDAINAARLDPSLPPAERRAALIEAMRKGRGPGFEAQVVMEGESIDTTSRSVGMSSTPNNPGTDIRLAIQQVLRDLPPGATPEQKIAAISAALKTVPHAGTFAALVDTKNPRHGAGGEVAGVVLEGLLEGLFGGS